MRSNRAFALIACIVSVPALAQNVIVVDAAGGPGSDYTDLAAAIAAANPGDILLLRSGAYSNGEPLLNTIVVSKPIALHADKGAAVLLTSKLQFTGLAPGESASLRGVTAIASPAPFGMLGDVQVFHCDGAVRIEHVVVGPNPLAGPSGGVLALAAADVAIAHAVVDPGPGVVTGLSMSNAVWWAASSGSIHASTIRAHTLPVPTHPTYGSFGNGGIALQNGSLFLSGCQVIAGDGGDGPVTASGSCAAGAGGDGIAISGDASVLTTLGNEIQPGEGGAGAGTCPDGEDGVAIALQEGVHLGYGGVARTLECDSPRREGEPLSVTAHGQSGDKWFLIAAMDSTSFTAPGLVGSLLLAPPLSVKPMTTLFAAGPGPQPATSWQQFPTHDLGPGVEGVLIRLQAAFLAANGQIHLSNESDVLLLDASL